MQQTFASDYDLVDLPPVSRFLQPITGWVLRPLLHLDRHRPGVLAEVTHARSRKRQAIYAALAAGALSRPQEFAPLLGSSASWHGAVWPALLAEALLTSDPLAVVATALGSAPDGYLTLLARVGPAPLSAPAYARLHAIFADPANRRRQQVMSESETLTDNRLDIVEILPIEALRPAVLRVCRQADDARMIAYVVELALKRGRSRADVAKQISDMGPHTSLMSIVTALTHSFEVPADDADLPSIPGARLLLSSKELAQAGRELENCLGSFPVGWATTMRETVFAVLNESKLILQLHRTSAGWVLSAVHRPANVEVSGRDRRRACQIAEEAGLAVLASVHRTHEARLVGALLDGVQAQIARRLD